MSKKVMYMDEEYLGVTPLVQADWNETDPNSESYIRNHPTITISTSEPTSADGKNGDIWLVYSSN
jgi:hypothetical protein